MDGVAPAFIARLQEQEHECGEQRREEADLENWKLSTQRLHIGIAARKQEIGEEAQCNALDRRMGGRHARNGATKSSAHVPSTPPIACEGRLLMGFTLPGGKA